MSTAFFDSIAEQWDAMERPDIDLLLARVIDLAEISEGMTVLDVGTGTGVLLPHLLRAVGSMGKILAIDPSTGMLNVARRKAFSGPFELKEADFMSLDPSFERYDRLMLNAVFPHLNDPVAALQQVWSLLKPGGRLVISHPIGREAVNRIHAKAGEVAEDIVPTAEDMVALLTQARFSNIMVIDEPEFYLARADRPICP